MYDTAFIVTPSNSRDAPTEARPGGTLKLAVAFDVPVNVIKGGVVSLDGYDDSFDQQYADFAFCANRQADIPTLASRSECV